MAIPNHLVPVVKRIRSLDITSPPGLWKPRIGAGVGGLTDVGFAVDTDLLLVISSQGRGVFDCITGERVARDRSDDGSFHDAVRLSAEGIGRLEGSRISLSGLHGGGLPTLTSDGWSVDDFVLDWPDHTLLLNGPFSSAYDLNGQLWKLGIESELRAWGFSPTGKSLVLATSSDLVAWARE